MRFPAVAVARLLNLVLAVGGLSVFGRCQTEFPSTGAVTIFTVPGSTDTNVNGLNNLGQIVGEFNSATGNFGFMLDSSTGVFTTIAYPEAFCTGATAINDSGTIVGFYCDTASSEQGFILQGGTFSQITYPGAFITTLYGINNRGDTVGSYQLAQNGTLHGFILSGGAFTTFDVPGSSSTFLTGINYSRQIVGNYCMAECPSGPGGFLYTSGTFADVNYPGATVTQVLSINDKAELSGLYAIGNQFPAFVYNGNTGDFFSFELQSRPTTADGINDSGGIAGTVTKHTGNVGFYKLKSTGHERSRL